MIRTANFRAWMIAQDHTINTASNYCSYLNAIDAVFGGLDEAIEREGPEGVLRLLEQAVADQRVTYPSDKRAGLKRYLQFLAAGTPSVDGPVDEETLATVEPDGFAFRFEREMQAQVRQQLAVLEPGLVAVDNGQEISIATGRIDILAEDSQKRLVVIELKAGLCPSSAFEQVLGYVGEVRKLYCRPVRAMLVAADFSGRTRAAASEVPGLTLHRYRYQLSFDPVD